MSRRAAPKEWLLKDAMHLAEGKAGMEWCVANSSVGRRALRRWVERAERAWLGVRRGGTDSRRRVEWENAASLRTLSSEIKIKKNWWCWGESAVKWEGQSVTRTGF